MDVMMGRERRPQHSTCVAGRGQVLGRIKTARFKRQEKRE
jgi:hypothetical protein